MYNRGTYRSWAAELVMTHLPPYEQVLQEILASELCPALLSATARGHFQIQNYGISVLNPTFSIIRLIPFNFSPPFFFFPFGLIALKRVCISMIHYFNLDRNNSNLTSKVISG